MVTKANVCLLRQDSLVHTDDLNYSVSLYHVPSPLSKKEALRAANCILALFVPLVLEDKLLALEIPEIKKKEHL